ncbi:Protein of unknown function [Propionibacterium freudenreichii]|uniref:Uncharacterized protein n=1 Tax=Propionibacterium freudenreichii subsp. freudenreichii TaxID=66712 RepID=A0A068VNN5_PROFF|nr:Protein of unknown function [Propionibacterium freudenreichii subsp. freudenreichii]CEG85847.1 Protein of unknown function [Propionibacterium freudenreichii]CEG89091.1 Protein of unknown function [Propionibacterium freudenreichii]CEG90585.1 Protein of unknown function [Propionibacterium freudenreichii]CEG93981.1 Protein of unknown function [Propionibacterium freudenreichii]
MAMKLNGETEQ